MWRKARIALLLFVLATVAHRAWLHERDLRWERSLYVALYPVNADGSAAVEAYLATLDEAQFVPVADYFAGEAQPYRLRAGRPFELRLGEQVTSQPPAPPRAASMLDAIGWSLRFRGWAWRNSPEMAVAPKIRLYLQYHDPASTHALSHSTALSKGRVGLVNLYAAPEAHAQNLVILAHELLHTVGASDKYDLAGNLPHFPDGYAEPDRTPRYPQRYAELMGGRVPLSATAAEMPGSLNETRVGAASAREIRWIQPD